MSNSSEKRLTIDLSKPAQPPTRDYHTKDESALPKSLPPAKQTLGHPKGAKGDENASIYFVGTATTVLEWEGFRLMTDPNFLHDGEHVHLGPGVTATRVTNPAIDMHELPQIDLVLLSHYHADHFDQKVEESLTRSLPIVTTPHAYKHLTSKGSDSFTNVHSLDTFQSLDVDIVASSKSMLQTAKPSIKVTAMPGKHVPPGILSTLNDLASAVPPTNGWIIELGYTPSSTSTFKTGYKIYISGDTLFVDELLDIPKKHPDVDLMLIHLGGTTIPSPKLPLLMVTMDAEQGIKLMKVIDADVTVPIHFDDYDAFLSPLDDFKELVKKEGLEDRVVYLDRGDGYKFSVKGAEGKGETK